MEGGCTFCLRLHRVLKGTHRIHHNLEHDCSHSVTETEVVFFGVFFLHLLCFRLFSSTVARLHCGEAINTWITTKAFEMLLFRNKKKKPFGHLCYVFTRHEVCKVMIIRVEGS